MFLARPVPGTDCHAVPGSATAAALIVVGVLMVQSIREIDFQDFVLAIPAFLTIVLMPFTYNIANGISFGIVTYVVLAAAGNLGGKSRRVPDSLAHVGTGGASRSTIHPYRQPRLTKFTALVHNALELFLLLMFPYFPM